MAPSLPSHQHVLLFAYPALGHMIPMLSLAESLVERNCLVTYVTSKNGAEDILKMWPVKSGDVSDPKDLRLRLVGVGSDVDKKGKNSTECVWDNVMLLSANSGFIVEYIQTGEPLPDLATELETSWPKPSSAICTAIATISAEVCLKAGLKTLILFDTNAYGILELSTWLHEELSQSEWKVAGSDTTTYDVLVAPKAGKTSVANHFSRGMRAGLTWAWEIAQRSHGVLVNSSEVLEPEQFASAKKLFEPTNTPLFPIGPLLPTSTFQPKPNALQPAVLSLLEKSGEGNVLYVSFGSFLNPPKEHLKLLAEVLKERKKPFIWSIRNRENMLEEGYEKEVEGYGVIVDWVDQKTLLTRKEVAFILSHMGWNSMLESCTFGVAAIAWPLGFDQLYNSDLLVSTFSLGLRFPDSVILSPASSVAANSEAIKAAINATLDSAFSSPIGIAAREKTRLLGENLRASLKEGGAATVVKNNLVEYLEKGVKGPEVGGQAEAVLRGAGGEKAELVVPASHGVAIKA